VKTIRVITRGDHQIADDTKECVAILNKDGIEAHAASKQDAAGFWVIWIHEDANFERALTMLRALGFPVVEGSRARATYDKSN
jgi:type III secretory pathway lipoprotein EscJ